MVFNAIRDLVAYGVERQLIAQCDQIYAVNSLLSALRLDAYAPDTGAQERDLEKILQALLDYACEKGIIADSIVYRDLLDTHLMGMLTPFPREVIARFRSLYAQSPKQATDWYYQFSQDTDYIRSYRICRDMRWKTATPYGELDITINLSKPEKDPKAIAAAKNAPQSGYPQCMLCKENEGYGGRVNHPARQNHRVIPITIAGKPWYFQYSPYVYYNEHCIAFSGEHVPMRIDRSAFEKMFSFIEQFPHYFIGSNADLPIVGGSILAHDHFQGGRYAFAMEQAEVEIPLAFAGFDGVTGGIVCWPMSVLRLRGRKPTELVSLAEKILDSWRDYTDREAFIFAETDGEVHNTITPIARMRNGLYELDLVLRNNITTPEHPLGVYHPHQELHHIKKENIGLIEVMGLAVLPARLKEEMAALQEVMLAGGDLLADEKTAIHAAWAEEIIKKHPTLSAENIEAVLQQEIGLVFSRVLEDAGVFKATEAGRAYFLRFVTSCGGRTV